MGRISSRASLTVDSSTRASSPENLVSHILDLRKKTYTATHYNEPENMSDVANWNELINCESRY